MEVAFEQLVHQPAGNAGPTHRRHFPCGRRERITVDMGAEPGGDGTPFAADIEGQVVDGAVEAREAVCVFVVVERGAGLGEPLVGEGVLQLLHLRVFVEVVFLHLAVFILWFETFRNCTCWREKGVVTDEKRDGAYVVHRA